MVKIFFLRTLSYHTCLNTRNIWHALVDAHTPYEKDEWNRLTLLWDSISPQAECQENEGWGWRGGPVVKSSFCSCRGPEFRLQQLHGRQQSVTPVLGSPTSTRHAHAGKILTHVKQNLAGHGGAPFNVSTHETRGRQISMNLLREFKASQGYIERPS